jgi:class 3 adenylate cyclase/tetratricopeptide (TPR) repeat protein
MKCPKCQFENPEDARFCNGCGHKLELACPECGKINPPASRFCNGCGHNLTFPSKPRPKDLSFDEKLEKIQRYLPKGLTEKILSQRDKIEGERKQVTVMFCDMEGFTHLVERLGPEEAYSIMDQIYEILIHKVHDYEGTVNEMTGDGIMALFGAPIALEDAPQRAIRSAYSVHREMAKFNEKIKQQQKVIPTLKMRIGIHTGPVVVGILGNDLRVEFKAVGDTVNLASRMEGLAEPATTYVTGETFKLTEGLFRFESLGELKVKGKEGAVKTYRVIAPSTRRTRFDVSAERGLTPLIGRERELELLLDGFERAKAGRGQAFSIMGEAGVGKSRFLYEFRKAVTNEDVTFLEGKCLSYSRAVAYHPVIDILKSNFDLQEDDGDVEIRDKVTKGLKILGADEASTLPYLLEILSVKDSGIDKIPMSPEARKDRIIEALKQIVLKGSEIRPLIMAIEDLHWVDKSSEESLKDLLDSISGARVFLLFTYRPEFVHTWSGKSYHSQVNLNRLSNRESLAMMSHLLGTDDIDRDLEELILEKTEGVPFFIEEFIRSLKDIRIIEREDSKYRLVKDVQEVTIPSTIQDVIMARVDSLPEGAKELLQTGSVIEREFSYELIKRVVGISQEEFLSYLSVLKDSELLYERGIYPQSTYIFKHALTREVVYDSILTKKKKALHEQIGNAIEELYKENINEHYGVLAEHFIESENYENGAEYSRLAGKKGLKTGSYNDAIAYFEKRISCLEKLQLRDDVEMQLIDARTALGLYRIQLGLHFAAKEAVDPILDLAVKHGYKKKLSQIYTILGAYNFTVEEDFPKSYERFETAISISDEEKDMVSFAQANYWLGFALSLDCKFDRALYHLKKMLNISAAANYTWAVAGTKGVISTLVYCHQGKVKLGCQTSDEAVQAAEESGDTWSKGIAYSSHGTACYCRGFFKEAKESLLKGTDFCERINSVPWLAYARTLLGDTYCEIGEYKHAIGHYNRVVDLLEHETYLPSFLNFTKINLAKGKVMNSEKDINLELLYDYVAENKLKLNDGSMRRYVGEILLNIDDQHMNEAEDWIKKALEADKKNCMIWELGMDYALYAELFKRKGDQPKAKQNLTKAIEIFKECGADGWVERAEKELASLS